MKVNQSRAEAVEYRALKLMVQRQVPVEGGVGPQMIFMLVR